MGVYKDIQCRCGKIVSDLWVCLMCVPHHTTLYWQRRAWGHMTIFIPYIYGRTAPGLPPLHLGSPKPQVHRLTRPTDSHIHRLTSHRSHRCQSHRCQNHWVTNLTSHHLHHGAWVTEPPYQWATEPQAISSPDSQVPRCFDSPEPPSTKPSGDWITDPPTTKATDSQVPELPVVRFSGSQAHRC